eukprot:COSAG04_NODE_281_length_18193_cov_4.163701_3_plen_163_part_00
MASLHHAVRNQPAPLSRLPLRAVLFLARQSLSCATPSNALARPLLLPVLLRSSWSTGACAECLRLSSGPLQPVLLCSPEPDPGAACAGSKVADNHSSLIRQAILYDFVTSQPLGDGCAPPFHFEEEGERLKVVWAGRGPRMWECWAPVMQAIEDEMPRASRL